MQCYDAVAARLSWMVHVENLQRALSLVGVLCLSIELAFNFTSSEIANCCDGSLKCCEAENFKTALYDRTMALHLIGSNQML